MPQSFPVATIAEVPPGTGKEVLAGDRVLALYNVNGTFYALDGICPHAGGPLAEGAMRGNIVTCPWHGWQFDVTTGQNCLNRQVCQPHFPVHVEGETIVVELS